MTEEECLEKVRLSGQFRTATIDVIYEMYTRMNARPTTRCRPAPQRVLRTGTPPDRRPLAGTGKPESLRIWLANSCPCLWHAPRAALSRPGRTQGRGPGLLKVTFGICPPGAINNRHTSESPLNFMTAQTGLMLSFQCGKNH